MKLKEESKSREKAMMDEMNEYERVMVGNLQSEHKALHLELAAVTLVCVSFALITFLTLRRA